MPFQLINQSQQDPRWKDIQLGFSSSFTLGTRGCALTYLSMWLSGVGYFVTPDKLKVELKNQGGFSNNELRWESINSLYLQVKYKNLQVCTSTVAPIELISASIEPRKPCGELVCTDIKCVL